MRSLTERLAPDQSRVRWILTRPRVVLRASKALGFVSMLRLVAIRLTGTREKVYTLRIPGYAHPVCIRGGTSSDAIALYETLVTGEYCLTTTLDSSVFIIDCGANVGMASLYFLNKYPEARVVAVEPDDSNLEVLRMNLAPYGNRTTIVHGAVWKNDGRLALQAGRQEWVTRVRDDQSGSVEAFALPSLMPPGTGSVDLLKVDIEGSELEVFGPEARQWLPRVRNIAIELHGEDCKDRFFDALKGFRYELSLKRTWTDPTPGTSISCYLAVCQNLRQDSASQ